MLTRKILALAVGASCITGAAQARTGAFDGNWSVEVLTEKGHCDRAYRYPVVIQEGKLRYGGSESFDVSGSVAPSGVVQGGIARGSVRASVQGRLSGANGSGNWSIDGSRVCSGRWTADKRG